MHVQDQAPPEAGGGSGEGGGLSHWQRTGLLKTWRLVHVSIHTALPTVQVHCMHGSVYVYLCPVCTYNVM